MTQEISEFENELEKQKRVVKRKMKQKYKQERTAFNPKIDSKGRKPNKNLWRKMVLTEYTYQEYDDLDEDKGA